MSGAVERYRPSVPERLTNEELKFIQNSQLLPAPYRGKPADIFACVLLGRQLGISDMHALRSIYVVDGKASISAELMVTLVRRHGHSITADYGDGTVTVRGKRADNGDEMSVTWTLEMAARAGLASKKVWQAYPESMLWARAVSQLCRMLFADVLSGLSYTPEEAELSPEDRIVEGIGTMRPPADDHLGPDDTPTDTDELVDAVIDGDAVLVPKSEGEPQAAPTVSPADPASEPGSPSDTPTTDAAGQASIFADMAERAQTKRRRHDPETGE